MINPNSIFNTIKSMGKMEDCRSVQLNHPDLHYIDGRINVFRNEEGKWAIVFEILGYHPGDNILMLNMYGFGNCLLNPFGEGNFSNYLLYPPVEFAGSVKDGYLLPGSQTWFIHNKPYPVPQHQADYLVAGIQPEKRGISVADAGRSLAFRHPGLFRATATQLKLLVPGDLEKILVLDEWYHQDPFQYLIVKLTRWGGVKLGTFGINALYDFLAHRKLTDALEEEEAPRLRIVKQRIEKHTPENCETWRLLAKVITTGNPALYQPASEPNTHWTNWTYSGFANNIRDKISA